MKGDNLFRLLKRMQSDERGLTAIELAVVVAMLAILAALVAGNVAGLSSTARSSAQGTDVVEVQKAADRWVTDQGSRYPVSTPVIVSSSNVVTASATPASSGLAASGSGLYVRVVFTDTFTNSDGATKTFVPDYLQRNPKHAGDSTNPWLIDATGKVTVVLSSGTAY